MFSIALSDGALGNSGNRDNRDGRAHGRIVTTAIDSLVLVIAVDVGRS
jgi:hypothetical protein